MSDALSRSAFAGLTLPGRFGAATGAPGVFLREISGLALASVIARRGQGAALAATALQRLAINLPVTPRRAALIGLLPHKGDRTANNMDLDLSTIGLAFTWAGPGQWLASASGGDSDALARVLATAFGNLASVCAQGDGRAALHISGPRAREVLAKGLALDLHATVFRPGDTAVSVVAHMGVQITQLDAMPSYEIILPRSFAGSFWHWLTVSAAEYGYAVGEPLAVPGCG